MPTVDDYLRLLVEAGGSDLHLKAGGPAFVRVDGDLHPVTQLPPLSGEDTLQLAGQMMDARVRGVFEREREADFAYAVAGLGRFRVNAFRQRGAVGLVCRRVLPGTQDFAGLGLPPAVGKLAEEHRGLVLVTGPTGSGKTTTTAAMLGHINATRRCHVVTLEDPIEVVHPDQLAIVDQREIGVDTADFVTGMKAVSRQDPDVIFIGEMRDLETVTSRLFEFVTDPAQLPRLEEAIAEGSYYGMETFDQHLLQLFADGEVALRDALAAATNPHDFRVALRGQGLATA